MLYSYLTPYCSGNVFHMVKDHPAYTPFSFERPYGEDPPELSRERKNRFVNYAFAWVYIRCVIRDTCSCLTLLAPESSAPEDLAECFERLIPLPNGTKVPILSPALAATIAAYAQASVWWSLNDKDIGPQFKTFFMAQFRYFNAFGVEVCRDRIRDILIEFISLFPSQAMELAHPRRKSGAAGVAIDQAIRPAAEAPP